MKHLLLFSILSTFIYCSTSDKPSPTVDNVNIEFKWTEPSSFKKNQLLFPRVRKAYEHKKSVVENLLKSKKVTSNKFELKFRAFKNEAEFEVWIKAIDSSSWILLKTYDVCFSAGNLGPKLKQGDHQVPEGIYFVDRFNPNSRFHLSLGINYPNTVDLKRSSRNPGGDIFIHGGCVSVGCIPLTNDLMEEVYILATEAKDHTNKKIQVEFYPFRMTQKNIKNHPILIQKYPELYEVLKESYSSI